MGDEYKDVKFVYKLVAGKVDKPFPDVFPVSEHDQRDGFIHLSSKDQVPRTADRFYNEQFTVTVLRLNNSIIANNVKWESAGDHGVFPHLFDSMRSNQVDDSKVYTRSKDEKWSIVFSNDSFFQ
eukprot:TRINITY_DN4447_c0_g1_i1.p1 TRINITY_DN4447_c0_g1~~TRINITY_DN4447_c0_g1_i1.p1  ORF type:complete len:124 (+),score=40.85 TRINITY_DN4447_c0_g1_i1:80-451(+)